MADLSRSDSEEEFSGLQKWVEVELEDFNLYNEEFKLELRQFCHHYQIPFLETNMAQTSKNAAKIYQMIIANKEKINKQFEKSRCVQFLQILSKKLDEIEMEQ